MKNQPHANQIPMPPILKMAIINDVKTAVEHLLSQGIDINNVHDEKGRTALILASSRGHENICGILLEHGANPDYTDADGNNALSIALAKGHKKVASLLQSYTDHNLSKKSTESVMSEEIICDKENLNIIVQQVHDEPTDNNEMYDVSVWEEYIELSVPESDPECLSDVEKLQYDISLMSSRDEAIDLDESAWNAALALTRKAWHADPARRRSKEEPDVPNGPAIRRIRGFGDDGVPAHPERGVLFVYAIDPMMDTDAKFKEGTPPIIAFGISFPGSNSGRKVEYKVNNVLWEQEYGSAE